MKFCFNVQIMTKGRFNQILPIAEFGTENRWNWSNQNLPDD